MINYTRVKVLMVMKSCQIKQRNCQVIQSKTQPTLTKVNSHLLLEDNKNSDAGYHINCLKILIHTSKEKSQVKERSARKAAYLISLFAASLLSLAISSLSCLSRPCTDDSEVDSLFESEVIGATERTAGNKIYNKHITLYWKSNIIL